MALIGEEESTIKKKEIRFLGLKEWGKFSTLKRAEAEFV